MENISDWVEWGFIALLTGSLGVAKRVYDSQASKIEDLEKEMATIDKRMAIIETKMDTQKEHLDQRLDAIDRLNKGDIDILLASKIFNKGADIPQIRSCLNAAAGKSSINALQRLGRGLRTADDKDVVVFFDFMDRSSSTLTKHSNFRKATYEDSKLEVHVFKSIDEIKKFLDED